MTIQANQGFGVSVFGATSGNSGSTLPVTSGGTGTSTAFTAGSVVFAGTSGVYSQDNANFFWDSANTRLGVGTTTPQYRLDAVVGSGTYGLAVRSSVASTGFCAISSGDATNSGFYASFNPAGTREVFFGYATLSQVWGIWGQANKSVLFASNNTEKMRITNVGNIHTPAGATSMTDGFFYMPAAAGAPSGTPTAITGTVPFYYDTTNNQFYVYNGAWKKVTLT